MNKGWMAQAGIVLVLGLGASMASAGQTLQACAQSLLERNAGQNLSYRIDWKGLSLNSERSVKHLGDGRWQALNNSSLLFMAIEESSQFRLDGGRIESRLYDYQRRGMSKKRNLKLEFLAGDGYKVTSPKGSGVVEHPAPVYDMLNHQLQLRIELACTEPRSEYRYAIARRGRVSEYTYRRIGEERVQTPAGELRALRLERGEPGDRLDQIWLAPDLGYLIVKLVHLEDGETAELVLVKQPPGNS